VVTLPSFPWQTNNLMGKVGPQPPDFRSAHDQFEYQMWYKMRTKSGGGEEKDYSCDLLEFYFPQGIRYVDVVSWQWHDYNDTAAVHFEIQETPGGPWTTLWTSGDLPTVEGCGPDKFEWMNGCYTDFAMGVYKPINGFRFRSEHNRDERTAVRLLGVSGFDCPANQTYSCNADGTATFSWSSQPLAGRYILRVDKNASSWYEDGIDIADETTLTSRTFPVPQNAVNSFSVQSEAVGENYPYSGNVCWQSFSCGSMITPTPTLTPPTPTPVPSEVSWQFNYGFQCDVDIVKNNKLRAYVPVYITIVGKKEGDANFTDIASFTLNQCGLLSQVNSGFNGDVFEMRVSGANLLIKSIEGPLDGTVPINSNTFSWTRTSLTELMPGMPYIITIAPAPGEKYCGPLVVTEPPSVCIGQEPTAETEVDTNDAASSNLVQNCILYCGAAYYGNVLCHSEIDDSYNCTLDGYGYIGSPNYTCNTCPGEPPTPTP